MRIERHLRQPVLGWLLIFCLLGGLPAPHSPAAADEGPDLQIRMRDVARFLQNLEALMPGEAGSPAPSRTVMIAGLLQGTDWIDPARSLVAQLHYDGQDPSWRILVPFQTPNEDFKKAYGAVAGDDFYVLRFPPAPEMPLSDRQRTQLRQASTAPVDADLEVELGASRLLHRFESRIATTLRDLAAASAQGDAAMSMAPEEIQQMVDDMIATVKQVENLRLGLALDAQALLFLLDLEAVPNSFLAGLLVDPESAVRLSDYRSDYPLRFRSRSYNVAGAIQMLGTSFGQLYRQMGFDVDELTELAKGLTGEMAGGMALDQDGMAFEMIYALHETVDGETYLTQVYLPWFQKYNRQMASLMQAQTGQSTLPLYERMPDTTMSGGRVFGVRTRFPAMTPAGSGISSHPALQDYETRLAAVDNLILMASSEAAMARLMGAVAGYRTAPAEGPIAQFFMDLGAYLKGLQGFMEGSGEAAAIPADIGELTMAADVQAGRLSTRTRMNVADIQHTMGVLAALSSRMAAAGPVAAAEPATGGTPGPAAGGPAGGAPFPEPPQTAAQWMDRGGLLSTYGNYTGAARCYRKALVLAPDLSEAHFQLGVAYGELGQFAAAVDAVSRAIDRQPTNGAYFYGRGRIFLKAGDDDLAMKDFMEAGFLGHEDARAYLQEQGVDWR